MIDETEEEYGYVLGKVKYTINASIITEYENDTQRSIEQQLSNYIWTQLRHAVNDSMGELVSNSMYVKLDGISLVREVINESIQEQTQDEASTSND